MNAIHELGYSELISLFSAVGGYLRHTVMTHTYNVYFIDESAIFKTVIDKGSVEETDFLNNYASKSNLKVRSDFFHAPSVHVLPPVGVSFKKVSHWWNDPTTWYQESTRITQEVLTTSDDLLFSSSKTNWINMANGKVYQEDSISAPYLAKIYVDDVEVTTGFTINYAAGTVSFSSPQTGKTIKANFSYAGSSLFTFAPSAGKVMSIRHTEVQFSLDTAFQPNNYIDFDIYGTNPADPQGPKILYKNTRYKSETDIICDANLGQVVPHFGNLPNSQDVYEFPFNYGTVQDLEHGKGIELRVKIKDDQPLAGSYATLTAYCLSEDEL